MIIQEIRGIDAGPAGLRYAVPSLPISYVQRKHLERRLEAGVREGLVIVSAPAGAGKTLLLASWVGNRDTPTAWLSLDPSDGETHQFWGRVLTAIQLAHDVPPDSVLARMKPPPVQDQYFVRLLVDACDELPTPCVVVLDDLHLLTGTPALASLASEVGLGLGNLRLVAATRSDPVIPLQRLRLEGKVAELRSVDLSFETRDAAKMLGAHGVDLPPEELATLVRKTEGWAAGLRLAALSLQGAPDIAAAIRELAGDHRAVADYFVEEVLARQDAAMTRFLLETSVVSRVSGELADALTGRQDGAEMLARLERENLFVMALDTRRGWYRYHPLFGDLLRYQLRSLDRARADELHRRAAVWLAGQGDPLEAACHLRAASDWVALSRLVLRSAGAELLGMQRAALATVLDGLPQGLVHGHPEVAAAAAVAAYARYDGRAVATHVRRARELLDQLGPVDAQATGAVLTALETILAWIDSDAAREVAAAEDAVRQLGEVSVADVPALRVYQIGAAVVEGIGRLWSGELERAEQTFATMLGRLGDTEGSSPVLELRLRGNRAVVMAFAGRLREARGEIELALATAEEAGWSFLPVVAPAYLADALVRLLEADAQGCTEAISRADFCIGELRDRHVEAALSLVEARLLADGSDPSAARKSLCGMQQKLAGWRMPPFLQQWSEIGEAMVALAEGDAPAAIGSLSAQAGTSAAERPYAQRTVVLGRAHLLMNRPRDCLATLKPLLEDPPGDHGPTSEAWLLAALAHDRLREDAQAQSALRRSIAVAAPEGIIRPYIVNGDRVLPLLVTRLRTDDFQAAFVRQLVARLKQTSSPVAVVPLMEPLTNREQSVLILLPTMMTNAEIADELHVSVNTVKVHLKGIYRKLEVASRRDAVARSRALGLVRINAT